MLINMIMSTLPLYFFSFFKAPKSLGNLDLYTKEVFMEWIKRNTQDSLNFLGHVCLPKAKGGIGVKNLEIFNLNLLAKWRCRVWLKLLLYGRKLFWLDMAKISYILVGLLPLSISIYLVIWYVNFSLIDNLSKWLGWEQHWEENWN